MADIKISALPAATSGAGADLIAIVQSGTTKQLTLTELFAAPRPIGATTPLAIACTTLTATGASTITPATDVVPLVLKGNVAATANLFDVQQSNATSIFKVGVGAVATSVIAVGSTLDWSGTTGAFTVAGGVYIAKKAMVIGDFAVATNKFTVASASGNTLAAGTMTVTGGFGCNGASAQTGYANAIWDEPGAGAFGVDSAAHMAALVELVQDMQAALVACGILATPT